MEIELGFQANCSELVTHLGLTKREDIIKALADIAKITGWSWWIEIPMRTDKHFPVRVRELDQVVCIEDGEIGVAGDMILELWGDCLDDDTKKAILDDAARVKSWNDGLWDSVEKKTRPREEITNLLIGRELYELVLVGDKEKDRLPGDPFNSNLTARYDCDCGAKGLFIKLFQHHQIEEMPAFHAIRTAFGSDFQGHDGGGGDEYITWMAYHFLDQETAYKYLKAWGTINKPEEMRYLMEHPPMDKSKGLSRNDMDRMEAWLDD